MGDTEELCAVCQSITVERISSASGMLLHENLARLQESSRSCPLCALAFSTLTEPKNTETGERTSPFWADKESLDHHVAIAFLVTWHTTASIRLRLQSSSDESLDTFDYPWMQVHTFENDHAIESGIPWLRRLPVNTSHEDSLKVARSWLKNCISGSCSKSIYSRTQPFLIQDRPTRLIEISNDGSSILKVVDGRKSADPYAALSYTWGGATGIWRTTTSNYNTRTAQFYPNELPKTIFDAVNITEGLTLRYLWVDSICIIQDDPADWSRESVRMAAVYRNAYVTIAASSSADSTAGIFNDRSNYCPDTLEHFEIENCLTSGSMSTLYLWHGSEEFPHEIDLSRGTLSSRGWCCQERVLSPRMLHFTETQLYWQCLHANRSEDNFIDIEWPMLSRFHLLYSRLTAELSNPTKYQPIAASADKIAPNDPRFQELTRLWYSYILDNDYSRRKLTYSRDKLIAVSGMAESIHSCTPMQYYAGLWDLSFVAGLCWRRRGAGQKSLQYRAPSWSWASQDSEIRYQLETLWEKPYEYAEVIDVQTKTDPNSEFGAVSDGHMLLRAPFFKAKVCSTRFSAFRPEDTDSMSEDGYTNDEDDDTDRDIVVDTGVVLVGRMDSDAYQDGKVIACLLALGAQPGTPSTLVFLLIEALDIDEREFKRVGLARLRLWPDDKDDDKVCIKEIEGSNVKTFFIR